jgi:hypothetical protein
MDGMALVEFRTVESNLSGWRRRHTQREREEQRPK